MTEENKNKKVVVFGGAGFLGSHVADVLTDRGYQVVIFDLKESPYLRKGQISVVGDITDEIAVEEATKDCQIVYNFAAVADMSEARIRPLDTIKANILGNAVLLEACRKNNVQRFVFASTLYVYSKAGSFYRSSKQASESLIENYQEIYGLNYTILRYGSLYGPRADESNWVRKILKQAITEGKITRHGNGEEVREYIHVYDAARLSVDVLAEEYKNQHVIIAGNQSMKIKDSLSMIREMLDNKIDLEFLPPMAHTGHYEITPYAFVPKLAKRIQSANYVDFGQGILNLINETYHECIAHQTKKAIVFDFDGVILESVDVKTDAFTSLFKGYPEHLPAILALHRTHGGISRFEKFEMIYGNILRQPLSPERKEELGRQFADYVYRGVAESPFVEGAREFLEKYHNRVPLFIASGTPEGEIRSIVKDRNLDKYFRGVYGSPLHKKDIILNIMRDFKLNPEDVVFVGDSIDDEEGARGAGVKFIWRTKENNPYQDLEKAINEEINDSGCRLTGRILITTSSFETKEALEKLRVQGFEVLLNPHERKVTTEELRTLLPGVVGLIAGTEKIDRETMKNSQLKVISRVGTGIDNIDLGAAKELGIAVKNTPDAPTYAVAELALGGILSLLRQIPRLDRGIRNKEWPKIMGNQLSGKTVLIIGFGRIGRYLAKLLEPFNVRILAVDPVLPGLSLEEALPQADIVCLHLSGSLQVLGEREFSIMKDGVYILNAARGGVVNEDALIGALKTGKVAGAWLDVFLEEPYFGPLAELSNVILTPHAGSYTKECRVRMETEAVDNLLSVLNNGKH